MASIFYLIIDPTRFGYVFWILHHHYDNPKKMWVVEQFHNSLRCSLKLVIQIFPPWSNHRYLTFLLRWFPLHAEIYLNLFKCFKLLPYQIYPHIYTQFIVGSFHEVEESPAHNYAQWTTYIIMYVFTTLVARSTLRPMNGVSVITF